MRVVINAYSLRDSFGKIQTVVDKKNSRPILTHCMINTADKYLELLATDFEVSAKIKVDAEIQEKGSFCINVKTFFDILKEMPNDNLILEIDSSFSILKLKCNEIKMSLVIIPHDDFPHLSFECNYQKFKLLSSDLQTIISKISHAISLEETRSFWNGIYLKQLDSGLRAVASDNCRLALIDLLDFDSESEQLLEGIILPKKGINEIKKLCDSFMDEELEISVDESFIYLSVKNTHFLSVRLVAREYPRYQSTIPDKTTYCMTVDKNSFLTAVKRVKIMASERSNGIKFSLKGDKLTLMANRPSLGDATERIDVKYTGVDLDISFNARYLMDAISVLESREIIFEFNNELKPVIIKSKDLPSFLGIVAPLKF